VAYNNETGPALIKSVEFTSRDAPVENFDTLLNRIKPDRTISYDLIRVSQLNNTVFKAGDGQDILFLPWTNPGRSLKNRGGQH